jgi:hypothetical protein
MSSTSIVQIGVTGKQTIVFNVTNEPTQILGDPLQMGRHMIVFIDLNTMSYVGSLDIGCVLGVLPQVMGYSANCFLETTDGSNFNYPFENSVFSVDYYYMTNKLFIRANPPLTNILAKEFVIPVGYTEDNTYAVDNIVANNPAAGSPVRFLSPLVQQYTGANSVNLGQVTVTQTTSSTTAVIVNSASGIITTVAITTGSGSVESFQVNNTTVSATSVVVVSVCGYSGSVPPPIVSVSSVSAGSFQVNIYNCGASSLDGVLKISFVCC